MPIRNALRESSYTTDLMLDEVLAVETVWTSGKLPANRVEFDLDGELIVVGVAKRR